MRINKQKNTIVLKYCGYAITTKYSDLEFMSPEQIALALINKIMLNEKMPEIKHIQKCQLINILTDGTEIYEIF